MQFPENIKDRESFIFDKVLAGQFEACWVELVYKLKEYSVTLQVMEDALKIDGVRVNVSAALQQKLADIFDASLITAQVADLMYVSAPRRINPAPRPISTTVSSMIAHSLKIDEQLKLLSVTKGLVSDPGKHWILDKKLDASMNRACNYGWHFTGSSYQGIVGFPVASKINTISAKVVKVIQPNAVAHDSRHLDYSQTCQLVSQTCWVDGVQKRFSELLVDPILSFLVNHQGPLKCIRQPGVIEIKGQIVFFPIIC